MLPPADGPLRGRAPVVLLVLAQVALPLMLAAPVLGHGDGDGHDEGTRALPPGARSANGAFPVAPKEATRQVLPAVAGDVVVWQEWVPGGRRWDIFGANLTTGTTFAIVGQGGDQVAPSIDRSIVAWTEGPASDTDVVMMDLAAGRIRVLGGTSAREHSARVAWPYVVWLQSNAAGTSVAAFDLERNRPVALAHNNTAVIGADTWGGHIVWAQRSSAGWRILDWTEALGRPQTLLSTRGSFVGPHAGPNGVALLSTGSGYVAAFLPWSGGELQRLETRVTPHANVATCQDAVVWDQGAAADETHGVALWDLHIGQASVFLAGNYRPSCSADWVVYEKRLSSDTTNVYALPLAANRPTLPPRVVPDEGMRERIVSGVVQFTGRIELLDTRVPLEGVAAFVDETTRVPVDVFEGADGALLWRVVLNVQGMRNGAHTLIVQASSAAGRADDYTLTFYVSTEGIALSRQILEDNRFDHPNRVHGGFLEEARYHYAVYARFYNTMLLLSVVGFFVARYVVRRRRERPAGKPEYVRGP